MKLLLDTHIALWLMFQTEELTEAEQAIIGQGWSSLAVSVVSLWEVRIKWGRRFISGLRKGPASLAALIDALRKASIDVIDLTAAVCVADPIPSLDHSDPFDELLLTQAQQGGYRLLTRDRKLASHPVALVTE